MKKLLIIIPLLILYLILSSKNKIYEEIGSLFICMVLLSFIITESYRYNKNDKRITGTCFKLQRNGFMNQIIVCLLFINDIFMDVSRKGYVFEEIEIFWDIFLLTIILLELFIIIIHVPKLSDDGFLCSDGKFIPFDSIKNIGCETLIFNNKKLIVNHGEKSGEFFKISKFDYENVKEHLVKYGAISISEMS